MSGCIQQPLLFICRSCMMKEHTRGCLFADLHPTTDEGLPLSAGESPRRYMSGQTAPRWLLWQGIHRLSVKSLVRTVSPHRCNEFPYWSWKIHNRSINKTSKNVMVGNFIFLYFALLFYKCYIMVEFLSVGCQSTHTYELPVIHKQLRHGSSVINCNMFALLSPAQMTQKAGLSL